MKDKIITHTAFPYFLGFTALLIALCAAFFSVYGIGNLFAGASFSAMVMAGSLEIGKLVATTFLYRYWGKAERLVKTYLTVAVLALMVITSAGIFGFLSAAYQKSSLTFKLNQEKIVAMEQSKGYYTNAIASASERIKTLNETRKVQEERLSSTLKDPILTRNPIQLRQIQEQTVKLIDEANADIKTENDKIEESRSKMQNIDEQVNAMKVGSIEKKDIQTFKFLADAIGVDLDTIAKWFIISLIFVFDPLAVALILAYNVVIYKKEDERVFDGEPVENKTVEVSEPVVVEEPITIVEEPVIEEPKTEIIQPETQVIVEEPVIEEPIAEPVVEETTTTTTPAPLTTTTPAPPVPPSGGGLISSQMDDYYTRMFKK